jgi:hypothetical protein
LLPVLCGLLVASLVGAPAFGWGAKEHVQFTRLAAARLIADPSTPPEMRRWLESIVPHPLDDAGERSFLLRARVGTDLMNTGGGVLYWSVEPDDRAQNAPRSSTREPFGRHERLMHYIDLELFLAGDTPRAYRDDLSARPPIGQVPGDWRDERFVQAGYLPFAVRHAFDEMVAAIRGGRLRPAEGTGGPDDDSAMRWAGYLAHYAQDNTQPHHSTVDFRSHSYFRNPQRAPNVHASFEWRLVDDETEHLPELREAYWSLLTAALREREDPVKETDPRLATLEVAALSYDGLPLIGRAAAAATVPGADGERADRLDLRRFYAFRGPVRGEELSVLELKARQAAWAIRRTEVLWRQAWDAAIAAGPLPATRPATAPRPGHP